MADPEDGADDVKASSAGDGDELAIINGVKPKKLLKDEEEVEVKGSGCVTARVADLVFVY
jgi:hypothetical protein